MKLEHANVTVKDIHKATSFLKLAFPSLVVRGGGPREQGGFWQHVGTQETYIALQQEEAPNQSDRISYEQIGINHLGFVVNDVKGIQQRLSEAGYATNEAGVSEEGRTSVYFYDDSGNEWEFVEYHTDDSQLANAYD